MSEQKMIDTAKAPTVAYNKKDWDAVRAAIVDNFVYDEVATHRRIKGSGQLIEAWHGWSTAFPDSKASFEGAFISGNKVVLEVTWRGKHTGPLQTDGGTIRATGKGIEMRSCQIVEIEGNKAKSMRQYFDMMTMMQQLGQAK